MTSPDVSRAEWRRSKYSGSNGNCVEVGTASPDILVRDTKDCESGTLAFSINAWVNFTASLK
jgi:Domain of unknown function (DUF397)